MKTLFYALTNRNLSFNFKQFDHHWKLFASFFMLFIQLFLVISINLYMKCWSISKIKHHTYKVLNLQVYIISFGVNSWKPVILRDFLLKKVIFITGMLFFLLLPPSNEFLQKFWTINALNNEKFKTKHWKKNYVKFAEGFLAFLYHSHLALR